MNMTLHLRLCAQYVSSKYFVPDNVLVISIPVVGKKNCLDNETHRVENLEPKNSKFIQIVNCESNFEANNATEEFTSFRKPYYMLSDLEDSLIAVLQGHSKWSIVVYSTTNSNKIKGQFKDKYYIVVLYIRETLESTVKNASLQIETLKERLSWNPRARFLVMINGLYYDKSNTLPNELLKLFWEFKVINVVLIIPDFCNVLNAYTWFPYSSRSTCMHVRAVQINKWIPEGNGKFYDTNTFLFPNKIGNDFKNCSIKASTVEIKPFVDIEFKNNRTEIHGIESRIFKFLMSNLKAKYLIKVPDSDLWGIKLPNGTWTGMKADIFNNVTEMGFGGLLLDTELCKTFDCTIPHFRDGLVWHVPRPKQIPNWESIYRVFTINTWLLFLVICIAVAFLLWGLGKTEEDSYFITLDRSLSHMWATILSVSVPRLPLTPRLRFLFVIWVIYGLHIDLLYLSFLTTFLINPGYERQVQNVIELVHSKLKYGYHEGFDKYFDDTTDEILTTIRKHRIHCEGDGSICLKRMVTKRDFANLVSSSLMEFKINAEFFDHNGQPLYNHFKNTFLGYDFVFYLSKGSPLLDTFNDIIFRISEAGLILQWWEEMKTELRLTYAKRDIQEESSTLSLSHLVSVYVFLSIGLAISFILFICEIIWFSCYLKRLNRRI
ncbi:Ionotropic receptor 568 [Blattella germanica]|nr:Ionotropic receptor 568 [Blattella germanica]